MGHTVHYAIVVTAISSYLPAVLYKAEEIFGWLPDVSPTVANRYVSFFIYPDGYKEQDPESKVYEWKRRAFVEWLREQIGVDWVEVKYGDDIGDVRIVSDSMGIHRGERKTKVKKRKRNTAKERLKSIERQGEKCKLR